MLVVVILGSGRRAFERLTTLLFLLPFLDMLNITRHYATYCFFLLFRRRGLQARDRGNIFICGPKLWTLCQSIPGAATSAVHYWVAFFQKPAEVLLERVPTRAGQRNYIGDGDPSVFACRLEDFHGQFGHGRQDNFLSFDFLGQPLHLLLKCAQEEQDPWLPIRRVGSDRGLRLTQREVVTFFAVFDHALQ